MAKKEVSGKNEAVDAKPVRQPDYVADGIAIWFNKDKNDKTYLAIKIVGHNTMYARENIQNEVK